MNGKEQKKAAKEFAARWKDKGYEKGESQKFWIDLLVNVYGVEDIAGFISFEDKVHLDHTSFIDGYIPSTHVMIEQKSIDKDLRKAIKQSDGTLLNPFQQAKRYASELPYSQRPRWIITCNFAEFLVYDMEKPNGEPEQILLKDLEKEYYRLQFLTDTGNADFEKEMQISVDAGKITEKLYKALLLQYQNPDSPDSLKSLNMLCVRLVFCFYADKANIFKHNQFRNYLHDVPVNKWHRELKDLFRIFDTKEENRDSYDDENLNAFPYVNGGLFADENIEIPRFTQEIADIILNEACAFEWQNISPTIFGAIFESTLNPETRRSGGMHYTSIENIHKVIDPLFLDDLKAELETIKAVKTEKIRVQKLQEYRQKLSKLTFLDPACGSGNFLTETYISLRRLENQALFAETGGQGMFHIDGMIQVSIGQFYGIEINDFAVTVAKTALWIAESQMMHETEEIMNVNLEFLPLKSYANIIEGNSLRIDWNDVIPKEKLCYIMGNPPFIGASMMSKEQKQQAVEIFGKIKLSNSIDYVGAWYFKACELIKDTGIKVALVSTNSITQGEQVAPLWGTLFERYKIQINFAYRTFRWDSEASLKAHVHCVIIGFGNEENGTKKQIFDNGSVSLADNISPYLLNAPTVTISSRSKPICNVMPMILGNKPADGGNFILSLEEKNEILKKEPYLKKFIYRYVGAVEFINNKYRYCFWLKNATPAELKQSKELRKRLEAVREMRLNSTAAPTREKANVPHLFFFISQPETNYLIIPSTSSERRRYVPIGFMPPDIIASNSVSIIPNATLYHFGVLTSNVHMSWLRTIGGRLKSDYRYTGSIVYNTFPWCSPTDQQKANIEKTAQMILDARAKYPDCSLADLYDETTMPPELRKAHQANDKAVMIAYGFDYKTMTESECVAELMKMYQKLISKKVHEKIKKTKINC
jgi:type I restriction-modification system DNA methylase subunit